MGRALFVRELSREESPEWSRVADGSPEGGPYAAPGCLHTLCEATERRQTTVAVFRGREIAGGVALYEEQHRFGTGVTPRLLLQCDGPMFNVYDTKHPSVKKARFVEAARTLLDDLASCGCHANDLTDSARNPATRFKSQLGGDLEPCFVLTRPETGAAASLRIATDVRSVLPGGGR